MSTRRQFINRFGAFLDRFPPNVKQSYQDLFRHIDDTIDIGTHISRLQCDAYFSRERQKYVLYWLDKLDSESNVDSFGFAREICPPTNRILNSDDLKSAFFKLPPEIRQMILRHAFQDAMEEDIGINLAWSRQELQNLQNLQYIFYRLCWDPDWEKTAPKGFLGKLDKLCHLLSDNSDQRERKIMTLSIIGLSLRLQESDSRFRDDMDFVLRKCMEEFGERMDAELPEESRRSEWDGEKKRHHYLRHILFYHVDAIRRRRDKLLREEIESELQELQR